MNKIFWLFFEILFEISLLIKLRSSIGKMCEEEGIIQNIIGIKKIGIIILIQFKLKKKDEEGSKLENRLVIMI